MEKLKPCPFCGIELEDVTRFGRTIDWAQHPNTDCFLADYEINMVDIEVWNARAT